MECSELLSKIRSRGDFRNKCTISGDERVTFFVGDKGIIRCKEGSSEVDFLRREHIDGFNTETKWELGGHTGDGAILIGLIICAGFYVPFTLLYFISEFGLIPSLLSSFFGLLSVIGISYGVFGVRLGKKAFLIPKSAQLDINRLKWEIPMPEDESKRTVLLSNFIQKFGRGSPSESSAT